MLVCSPASCLLVFSFLDRVFFEACALVRSQPFHVLGSGASQLSSLATLEDAVAHGVRALLEAPPEPVVWIPATGLVPRLAHLRPRSRSRSPLPKTVPSRPRGSTLLNQGAPRVFPSRALLWPRLIARSPLAATPAPRPLPTALLSHGARDPWLAAPLRVSHVLQPLLQHQPLLGRQVRGVVPQAPLKHGNAGSYTFIIQVTTGNIVMW